MEIDRQRQQQELRQTRRDILCDKGSSNLWVPYPDCGDRFLESQFPPRQQVKHTHTANNSILQSTHLVQWWICTPPGQCAFGWERCVREGRGRRIRSETGEEKEEEGGVWCEWSVGVWFVFLYCVFVFMRCVCFMWYVCVHMVWVHAVAP